MIKELVKDISYDKVTLNQALTRAKLVAYKIDNNEFISWINKELNGYDALDIVPEYREFYCEMFVKVQDPYYGSKNIPIDLTEIDERINGNLYNYVHRAGILNIEQNVIDAKDANEQYGYIDFPIEIVRDIVRIFQRDDIIAVRRRIIFGRLHNILNMTKQTLLDTLLELNKAFPNLEDEYMNDNNKEKADQIITNIYGNNASTNVGVGNNFTQGISNSYTEKVEQTLNDLRHLGVPNEDIIELETIINSEPDKSKLGSKFFAWSSALATKAIEKGIDVKVPEVLDAIQNLIG